MRLLQQEINDIKTAFQKSFDDGKIYLFGSRVDDTKKGGDIDLFIELNNKISSNEIFNKKSAFRLNLYEKLGEQKIDIIISKDKSRSIEQEIIKTMVLL